jgi:hypothetical protein
MIFMQRHARLKNTCLEFLVSVEEPAPPTERALGNNMQILRNEITGTAPNYQQCIASLVQAHSTHCMVERASTTCLPG